MREWDRQPVAAVCRGPDSSSDDRAEQLERYMHPSQSDHSIVTDASPVASAGACRGQSCNQARSIHHHSGPQPQKGPTVEGSDRPSVQSQFQLDRASQVNQGVPLQYHSRSGSSQA
eukprot:4815127-Pyramimonas_sp.AAC.1